MYDAPTVSSFNVVDGISASSSAPTTPLMNGVLDRLTFRPKSLAARKFNLHVGEYEKAASSSTTAASARLGLPVRYSSTSSISKYGVGLSSTAGTCPSYPTNGREQYHHTTGLELALRGGVDVMMKFIEMDFVCLYCSGRIGQAYRLLERLASSRHLFRSDLASTLVASIQHEIALELAQDKVMAQSGKSIVRADDESALVVAIHDFQNRFYLIATSLLYSKELRLFLVSTGSGKVPPFEEEGASSTSSWLLGESISCLHVQLSFLWSSTCAFLVFAVLAFAWASTHRSGKMARSLVGTKYKTPLRRILKSTFLISITCTCNAIRAEATSVSGGDLPADIEGKNGPNGVRGYQDSKLQEEGQFEGPGHESSMGFGLAQASEGTIRSTYGSHLQLIFC